MILSSKFFQAILSTGNVEQDQKYCNRKKKITTFVLVLYATNICKRYFCGRPSSNSSAVRCFPINRSQCVILIITYNVTGTRRISIFILKFVFYWHKLTSIKGCLYVSEPFTIIFKKWSFTSFKRVFYISILEK